MNWESALLDPTAPDAAYTNKPIISRAIYDTALNEIKRLEEMLLEGTERGAGRCNRCESVRDLNDITEDGMACWVCERRQ